MIYMLKISFLKKKKNLVDDHVFVTSISPRFEFFLFISPNNLLNKQINSVGQKLGHKHFSTKDSGWWETNLYRK